MHLTQKYFLHQNSTRTPQPRCQIRIIGLQGIRRFIPTRLIITLSDCAHTRDIHCPAHRHTLLPSIGTADVGVPLRAHVYAALKRRGADKAQIDVAPHADDVRVAEGDEGGGGGGDERAV